jgi:periplasmic divalent cation tolerance protein
VVLVTGPDRDVLLALGRSLVQERLAACANVVGGLRSVYRWGGSVEEADEALAILKTTRARLEDLTVRIRALHPYDEPEVVAVAAAGGSASYLAWVAGAVADA